MLRLGAILCSVFFFGLVACSSPTSSRLGNAGGSVTTGSVKPSWDSAFFNQKIFVCENITVLSGGKWFAIQFVTKNGEFVGEYGKGADANAALAQLKNGTRLKYGIATPDQGSASILLDNTGQSMQILRFEFDDIFDYKKGGVVRNMSSGSLDTVRFRVEN